MSLRIRISVAAAAIGVMAAVSGPAFSGETVTPWQQLVWGTAAEAGSAGSENAMTAYINKLKADYAAANADIKETFGVVPAFFHLFPEDKLAGIWTEFKNVELNPDTALDAKMKQLIALAVAAQIPCGACLYFHASAALANGATAKEIQETVAVSVIGREWSKVLTDEHVYVVRADTNALVERGVLKVASPVPMN